MGLYTKDLQQLVVLQEVDNQILALAAKLSDVPQQLSELQDKYQTANTRREQIEERIEILKVQQNKLEDEITNDGLKVQKSKDKLMQVENTKEYHAMMREMDSLEKTNRIREEEKVAVLEDLQQQKEMLTTVNEEIDQVGEELKSSKTSLDKELTDIRQQLTDLEKKSQKLCEDISEQLLEQYNFIKRKLSHPVVASISDAICNGCHIKIPLQTYIEVQKGEFISTCPNCQRIIYWDQLFSPTEAE